jgi:regulator of sirC expression with transglutaminase-like and TPR domain
MIESIDETALRALRRAQRKVDTLDSALNIAESRLRELEAQLKAAEARAQEWEEALRLTLKIAKLSRKDPNP